MSEFRVSAPGKIILHGEHAVVYGKTAIAASVNIRTTLDFKEMPKDCEYIVLSMPKIGLYANVPVKQVRERFYNDKCSKLSDGHDTFHNYVGKFVEKIGYTNFQQKFALEGVFYLLVSISQMEFIELRPFQIVLDTALTIGAGLGSSASFSVCLATAFVHWSHIQKNQSTLMDEQQLEAISKYAFNCEQIMHGNPSGLDNSISTFGSIIEFRRGEPFKPIPGVKNMRALLVDTRVQRSTKALVDKFSLLKEKYPMIFSPILDSMDQVAKKAIEVFKNIQTIPDGTNESLYQAYKELMVSIPHVWVHLHGENFIVKFTMFIVTGSLTHFTVWTSLNYYVLLPHCWFRWSSLRKASRSPFPKHSIVLNSIEFFPCTQ